MAYPRGKRGAQICNEAAASIVAMAAASDNSFGADKSQYSLFNPTPRRLMREMTTDRPDTTEVPFTVDAGHVQTESTLFGYTRTRPDIDGAVSDAFDFAYTNVRIGLTNDVELSLIWQPYGHVRTRQADREPTLAPIGNWQRRHPRQDQSMGQRHVRDGAARRSR